MLKKLLIIGGLLATLILLVISPATYYVLECILCTSALFFIIFEYLQHKVVHKLFPYFLIMLVDYSVVSFAWVNVYFQIIPRDLIITFCWILGIAASLTFCLLLEFLMTDAIQLTRAKKIIGFLSVGLAIAWLLEEYWSPTPLLMELITWIFNFILLLVTFWQVLGITNPQKTKIRNDIKYIIGPYLVLYSISILLFIYFGWLNVDYDSHFRRAEIMSGVKAYLILSFLTITFLRDFHKKRFS